MISLECLGNDMVVRPIELDEALRKMRYVDNKRWSNTLEGWIVPRTEFNNVVALFGINIKFLSSVDDFVDNVDSNIYSSQKGFDGINFKPYPFQVVGANFAVQTKKSLIADYMGLGKTMQAILAYAKLKSEKKVRKMLVVTPASVKYQWLLAFANMTSFKAMVVKSPSEFSGKNLEVRTGKALEQLDLMGEYDAYIVNYETLSNQKIFDRLQEMKFNMVVFDEIHYTKNRLSIRSKKSYEIAKGKQYVIGLSGTPLENNPPELFGVFRVVDNTLFPTWTTFEKSYIKYVGYGIIGGYRNLPRLRKKIQPYIIRLSLIHI